MKKSKILSGILMLFLTGGLVHSQAPEGELKLSLQDAQEYAIRHNKSVNSSRMDVAASKTGVWEAVSAGLPQVTASGSFTDNLKLMTTLLPGELVGQPGELIPVTFGSKFNSSASIQASLVLFSAPYFIGVETSKLAQRLSQENLAKSELDTKEAVASAYYLILVSEKSLEILNENLANLHETLKSTKVMYAAGMAESTDVDQMESNVSMVENSRSSLQRTIEMNYNLLRFQLGVTSDTPVVLTETLEDLTADINVEALLSQEFDHTSNINYQLMAGQEQMSALALKTQKAAVLPTLAGFYNYGTNGMGDKVNQLRWFPNSMTGLQLSIPIFGSGQQYSRIKKAKINLEKARNNTEMIKDQLMLQEKQLRYNLVNANMQYKSQKDNIEVAKRVYESMKNKYKHGMASSLDLTQSNSLYLDAENNYISALMNLLQTKLALDKLLNNI
ncbi:MAG TPA: TolC family protein [Bacteroidales bacterium]|nr:TolC family protein [Bacteroidales bacterium]